MVEFLELTEIIWDNEYVLIVRESTRIYQDPSMKIVVMDGHRQGKKANAYKYPLTFLK